MGTEHRHRVCTCEEAETAIRSREYMFLNSCCCRTPAKEKKEPWDYCGHALETCIALRPPKEGEVTYPSKRISQGEALVIFENWKNDGGFFRFMVHDAWICCCCSCGCGFFRDKEGNRVTDTCDKSDYLEKTNTKICTACGTCVDVCAFDARALNADNLELFSDKCYGCSACVHVCPTDAIEMVARSV